jgi:hypothetical protein
MPRSISAPAVQPAPTTGRPHVPWRDCPLLPLRMAGEIAGISPASLYRFADIGKLKLRRLAGRTLVDTSSLIELLSTAEAWKATERGKEARAKRKEIALSALSN